MRLWINLFLFFFTLLFAKLEADTPLFANQLFVSKGGVTFWYNDGKENYFISKGYQAEAIYGIPSSDGTKTQALMKIVPVQSNDPNAGYFLKVSDRYVSTKILLPEQPSGGATVALMEEVADAAIFIPVVDIATQTFYLQQIPSQGSNVLTLDTTNGYVTHLQPYQATNTTQFIQHFSFNVFEAPQYFWIVDPSTDKALQAVSNQNGAHLEVASVSNQDNQLWLFDLESKTVSCKENGLVLDLSQDSTPTLCLNPLQSGKSTQSWIFDKTVGALESSHLYAVVEADHTTVGVSSSNGYKWVLSPYIAYPEIDMNQLDQLTPGSHFTLSMNDNNQECLLVAGSENASISLVPSSSNPDLSALWTYQNGSIINLKTNLALDVSGNKIITSKPSSNPSQSWVISGDNLFVNGQTQTFVTIKNGEIVLDLYNPIRDGDQFCMMQIVSSDLAANHPLASLSSQLKDHLVANNLILAVTNTTALKNITSLQVQITLSNDWFAGTGDIISIKFNNQNSAPPTTLLKSPSAGASNTVEIDLQQVFGQSSINFGDIKSIQLYQSVHPNPLSLDDFKVASIILIANGVYKNDTYANLNKWISSSLLPIEPSWSGGISLANWSNSDQKPVDLNGKTYAVGLIPWLADIKSWRSYDPSTIDGVGQLIGVVNGQLVGQQLKTKKCEILNPNSNTNSYTWVYTPDGSVIYKLWDHTVDRNAYVRHSQLGSGNPVICAGEWKLDTSPFNLEYVVGEVNNASGHYLPMGNCLEAFSEKLNQLGIPTENISWYWLKDYSF